MNCFLWGGELVEVMRMAGGYRDVAEMCRDMAELQRSGDKSSKKAREILNGMIFLDGYMFFL